MFWRMKKRSLVKYVFWMSDEACEAGLVADIRARLKDDQLVLVVTNFTESHQRVRARLTAAGVACQLIADSAGFAAAALEAFQRDHVVGLIPFPALRLGEPYALAARITLAEAAVLMADVYPTPARDALVEAFMLSLPYQSVLAGFVSLESRLIRTFGGERTLAVMQRLGLPPQERVEHPLLNRSLASARERLGKLVEDDQPMASEAEWFARHAAQLPGGGVAED